ncbi:hypothetical protein ColKHC_10659 [Colletotrichum higginsianum]|nr:hypothetical protein ColKHC_10659 [Colletotrichum higginsianum]
MAMVPKGARTEGPKRTVAGHSVASRVHEYRQMCGVLRDFQEAARLEPRDVVQGVVVVAPLAREKKPGALCHLRLSHMAVAC